MQKLETVKNHGQIMKSYKGDKKSKITGNSQKSTENNLQFTEILGQLSLSLPLTQAAQPDSVAGTVKLAKARTERVGKTDQSAKNTQGKNEVGITSKVSNKPINMLAKAKGNESTGEVTDQSDSNQVNASITGKKVSGTEKSLVARNVEEIRIDVTSINMGNGTKSETRAAANIMGSQVDSVAKSMAGTIGENHRVAASNPSKSTSQSEIKIADLMLANNNGMVEKPALQSVDKKLSSRQEASTSSTSSARIVNDRAVNNTEKTKNNDKEAGSDSRGAETPATKTENANNLVIRENGGREFKIAEFDGVNVEKTMLGKNQTDLLVSKMIEQIKVAPSSLEVSLKPEYLGKINILVQSIAGVISVNVIAQNPEALNLLNSNLQNIKDNLEQQGINVQQLEVNLANQEKQNNRNSHGFRGQSQASPLLEKTNTLTDYGSLAYSERSSLLSRNLNLLA